MTPATLFKRTVERDAGLQLRWKNPQVVSLSWRHILLAVLKLIAESPVPGVFKPDPDLDGLDPLPTQVARSMDAVGAEQDVCDGLAGMARLGFFKITSAGCIVLNIPVRQRHVGSEPTRSFTSRSDINSGNGSHGGRPRKGETAEAAYARRQSNPQGTLLMPLQGHVGPIPYGSFVEGEELAQLLRSQFRVVETLETEKQMETEIETHASETENPIETQFASDSVSVGSSRVMEEEEESNRVKGLEEKTPPPQPTSSSPRATETETEPKSETEKRNPESKPKPVSPIQPAALELNERAGQRFDWRPEVAKHGARIFQDLLDQKWTVDQIRETIDKSVAVNGPGFFRTALPKAFGAPGQAILPSNAAPADTSKYPPDLAGEWVEPIAKIRARFQQSFGAEYKSWLGDLRFLGFVDGRMALWVPRSFQCEHVRNNFSQRMLRIITAIEPKVTSINLSYGFADLAKAS